MARPSLLTSEQVDSELQQLPGWTTGPGEDFAAASLPPSVPPSLNAEFEFMDFTVAFAFMSAIATVAERMGHHPDWSNSYNRVTISLSTHDVGGITVLDVELARKICDLADLLQAH